jgi:hypothetical protein
MDKYSPETEFLEEIRQKSLSVNPPCYSQSSLQLRLEISISSNLRNLLQFLHRRKEEKPDRKNYYPLSCGLRNRYRNFQSGRKLSRLCPETSMKMYFHEFGFRRDNLNIIFFTLGGKVILSF